MDVSSRAAQLCIEGTRAEFEGRIDDARECYSRAWDTAATPYEQAIAAHYVAHLEPSPDEALRWHRLALEHAESDDRADEFMGSLLVSLGGAYEGLGMHEEAARYFGLASRRGVHHAMPARREGTHE